MSKLVITLTNVAADHTTRMADEMNIKSPEVVRRGLMILDFMTSLPEDEELVIRNKNTGEVERFRIKWGFP